MSRNTSTGQRKSVVGGNQLQGRSSQKDKFTKRDNEKNKFTNSKSDDKKYKGTKQSTGSKDNN